MEHSHPVVHGKHRRKPSPGRFALTVLALALLTGALVVAVVWRGVVDTASGGGGESGSAPGAVGQRPSESHQHAPATPAGTPKPAASEATPTVGSAIAVGQAPHHVAVAPGGRFAYIADPVAGAVIRFDTVAGRSTATIPVPQGPPQMVTFAPDGTRAYVSVYKNDVSGYNTDLTMNHIVFLDTRTDSVIRAVPVGKGPYAAATTSDGRRLYVPFYDEDYLDVIDTDTGTLVTRIPTAPSPHWIAMNGDSGFGYVTNHFSDVITVLNLRTNSVVTTIPVGRGPHSLEMSPDGTRVAVVNYVSDNVSIIDTATNAVIRSVPGGGAGPQDIAYAPDGRHFYTANVDDGTVSVVDVATGTVTARIATGESPTSVAVLPDGRRALVTNFGDGTVSLVDTAAAG